MSELIKTPINLISSFVGVLRQYFGTENRITMEASKYLWKESLKDSDVWISHEFNDSPEVLGKRPAILVSFPQASFQKNVLADMMNFSPNGEVRNMETTQGNIRLRCISSSAMSSVELATEVKYFVSVFRNQIQQDYCLDYLRPSGLIGPNRIEEYKEYWTSDVICDIIYQENWGIVIEHLRVKSINVDLTTK
jgi:hypothetical protein